MAITGKISSAMIKIALQGYEAAKTQLSALAAKAKESGDAFKTIGQMGAAGFATATASIAGFLSAADPYRFTIFTQKLEILSIHIGRIFIPLLIQVTDWLDQVINYFRSMSDEQREQILYWTKVVLVILGVIAALATFVAIGAKVIAVIRAISVAFTLLGYAGPVRVVVLVAMLLAGLIELLRVTGGLDALWKVFVKIGAAIGAVVRDITDMTNSILELIGVIDDINPVADKTAKGGKAGEKKDVDGKKAEPEKEKSRTERFWDFTKKAVNVGSLLMPSIVPPAVKTGVDSLDKVAKKDVPKKDDKKDDKKKSTFTPMMPYRRMEMFGLEEGFKRAQAGAMFDPAKLAAKERDRLAAESASSLKSIDGKIRPERPAAEAAY